jgi:hypothetical protein
MSHPLLIAGFLQFAGTIGSGIFVLPYLFHHSNLTFSSFFLIFFGLITIALNFFYADIILVTPGDHQLAGYARKYLNHRFEKLAVINLVLLSFGAITAYLKLFQSFASYVLPALPATIYFVAYIVTLGILYFAYYRLPHYLDAYLPVLMLIVPALIYLISLFLDVSITTHYYQPPRFSFVGATIYALSGFTIIPEIQEFLLRRHTHQTQLKLAVTLGVVITVVCYFMFSYGVIRLSRGNVSIDSVTGLFVYYPWLTKLIALFGSITVVNASLRFLIVLRELFYRDLRFNINMSNLLPLLAPVLSLGLGGVSLLAIISLTGHITIYISSLIICLIRLRLPHGFQTQFFSLLIIICLSIGLIGALIT